MRWCLAALFGCASSHPHAHSHTHPVGEHRFEHADQWAPTFDDPARDAWQKPDEVVAALDIQPGMTVADIGAGTGYFESRLAKLAARVLAVDVEPDMVRYLRERAARDGWSSVEAVLATPDDPNIRDVDRILIVDTWHHIPSRADYNKRLAAALRPGGFVLVVDFTQESDKGPPKHHRVTAESVMQELSAAGLQASVVDETLPDQYIVRAVKAH